MLTREAERTAIAEARSNQPRPTVKLYLHAQTLAALVLGAPVHTRMTKKARHAR